MSGGPSPPKSGQVVPANKKNQKQNKNTNPTTSGKNNPSSSTSSGATAPPPSSSTPGPSSKGKNLGVTQINLNRSHHAWDDIIAERATRNHIILSQEPPLTHKQGRVKASGGYIAIYDKSADKPRASIMVHKDLSRNVFFMDALSDRDTTTILLKIDNNTTVLSSMYMDRDKPCPPPLLGKIAAHAASHNNPLIVGTDSNAHNSLWGSRLNDSQGRKRGDELVESLLKEDLHIANSNSPITFDNGRWTNAIDLTISNNQGINVVQKWQTNRVKCHSDHIPITFNVGGVDTKNIRTFYNPKKTDWTLFGESAEKAMNDSPILNGDIINPEDLENHANTLAEILLSSYKKSTPLTHISATTKNPVWLTEDVKAARRSMISALSAAQSGKTPQLWEEAKEKSKEYKKIREKSKRKAWQDWTEELDSLSHAQKIGQIIKSNPDTKLSCLKKPDGSLTSGPVETLETMRDSLFGEDHSTRPSLPPLQNGSKEEWPCDLIFSTSRITRALKEFRPLTAAGPDEIKPIMMQKSAPTFVKYFQKIAIASFSLGVTPQSWQEAEAIYQPKPGKSDYRLPKSFRTITLASNLQKLMERLVLWHIEVDQKIHKKLNKKQFGFRRGASTDTALHKVVRKIENTLMHKGIAMATFLDIEGAFDNVAFSAIERALHNKLKDTKTAKWITYMISNRQIKTSLLGHTLVFRLSKGCPQGGILSPFLWNLVMDDLLNLKKNKIPGDLQGFADDLCLLAMTISPPTSGNVAADIYPLKEVTQKSLTTINKWCRSVGLKLSALKSHIVIFTHRQNVKLREPIKIMGHEIKVSNSTKFLGVTLDSKLNWSEHIDKQINKCKQTLFQCRRAVGPTWGFTPQTMLWIYRSIIRPMLSYGALVWSNAMLIKKNKTNTAKIQRMALLMVTGAMPSTPGKALDIITNTTPIVDHLRLCAVKTAYTLRSSNQWEGKVVSTLPRPKMFTSHANTVDELLQLLPEEWDHDHTLPQLILDRAFSMEIPDAEDFKEEDKDHTIIAYTDGSRIDNNAGAGLLIRENGREDHTASLNLGDTTTVPMAEMVAIQNATKHLLSSGTANQSILINCDSQGTIKALDSTVSRSKTTLSTISNLNALAVFNTVKIRWIPAHKGHEGNELADTLAKKGAREIQNITRPPIPKQTAYAALRERIKTHLTPTAHMNQFWNPDHAKKLQNLDRTHLRAATQLLTGHNTLNYHLHKINKASSPNCRLCGLEDETAKHLLTDCPALWTKRQERFDRLGITLDDIKNGFPITKTVSFYMDIIKHLNRGETA